MQASLTGHLVLSTLHTNDAPNAVTRLVDMGMEPYKIASALRGVVAQRLMRRVCLACREVATEPLPERLARFIPAGTTLYKAVGCPQCAQTGYRGRFSIVEVLTMNAEIERRIGQGATADQIADAARANGMGSLFDSGLRHVLAGHSTLDELLRVTDIPQDDAPARGPERERPSRTRQTAAPRSRSAGRTCRSGARVRSTSWSWTWWTSPVARTACAHRAAATAPASCWWRTRTSSAGS